MSIYAEWDRPSNGIDDVFRYGAGAGLRYAINDFIDADFSYDYRIRVDNRHQRARLRRAFGSHRSDVLPPMITRSPSVTDLAGQTPGTRPEPGSGAFSTFETEESEMSIDWRRIAFVAILAALALGFATSSTLSPTPELLAQDGGTETAEDLEYKDYKLVVATRSRSPSSRSRTCPGPSAFRPAGR